MMSSVTQETLFAFISWVFIVNIMAMKYQNIFVAPFEKL